MITLIQPWYVSPNKDRNIEFKLCLAINLTNECIGKIVLLCEHPCEVEHEKLMKINIGKRANYNDMLVHSNGITVLANTDIYFNDTLALALNIKENECYALSRWDEKKGNLVPFHGADTQDVWIFNNPKLKVGDYGMGMPGCDNRIAKEILDAGYKITNPCLSIQAIHLHESGYRTYTQKDTVHGNYHFVLPCRL
jgi:hypothetical protein